MKKHWLGFLSVLLILLFFSCEMVSPISESEFFRRGFHWTILHNGNPHEPDWIWWGDSRPFIQTNESYSGEGSIQLGSLGTSGHSALTMPMELEETSLLSFWVKVDPGGGNIRFKCDDSTLLTVERLDQWTKYEYTLTPGNHTLQWLHEKYRDGSDEQAWIDQIEITWVDTPTPQNFPILYNDSPMEMEWTFNGDSFPFLQSEITYQGQDALQLGTLGRTGECTVETSVSITENMFLSFWAKADPGGGYIMFECDDSTLLTVERLDQWTKYEYTLTPGNHTLKWLHDKYRDGSDEQAWIDQIEITSVDTLTPQNFPILFNGSPMAMEWTFNGDSFPFLQSEITYQGQDALQLGTLGRTGICRIETSITITENSLLSFWAKADPGGGYLYFYCDGSRLLRVDRLDQWTRYEYTLTPGNHTLIWQHYKSYDGTNEQAWIAAITLE